MFSAHKIRRHLGAAVVGALSLCAASGCTNQQNSKPEPGDTELLIGDEATNHRVWERSHAQYANMNVVAGPVGDPFVPNENMPDYQRAGAEPTLFVGNTLILPGVFIFFPPWMQMQYRGDAYAPTYTGNGAAQLSGAIVTPNTPPAAAAAGEAAAQQGVDASGYPTAPTNGSIPRTATPTVDNSTSSGPNAAGPNTPPRSGGASGTDIGSGATNAGNAAESDNNSKANDNANTSTGAGASGTGGSGTSGTGANGSGTGGGSSGGTGGGAGGGK